MTIYYHGGPPNLSVILPPSITGTISQAEYGNFGCRRDRVYITTSYEAAMFYGVGVPNGVVYVVDPVYPLEADPDCDTPGLSYGCRKARVLSVVPISDKTREALIAVLMMP